jgi:hypothetical protein
VIVVVHVDSFVIVVILRDIRALEVHLQAEPDEAGHQDLVGLTEDREVGVLDGHHTAVQRDDALLDGGSRVPGAEPDERRAYTCFRPVVQDFLDATGGNGRP